jgi:hypothetical protein
MLILTPRNAVRFFYGIEKVYRDREKFNINRLIINGLPSDLRTNYENFSFFLYDFQSIFVIYWFL